MQDAPSEPVEELQDRRRADRVKFARTALTLRRRDSNAIVMMLLLGAFLVWILQDSNVRQALVLIGVLVFHELGHLVAMRKFGFSDLRMFFLPGFGAAATGRKPGASAVEHAIVSLAGPLPGLVLGAALLTVAPRGSLGAGMPLVTEIVLMLAVLNVFNLVPIVPFDGGRFFETVLFSRWPALDAAFRLVGIAGAAWIAMKGLPMLGVVAAALLFSLRRHASLSYEAVRLRRERMISPDVQALGDDDLLALYAAAEVAVPATGNRSRTQWLPSAIVELHDRAARQPAPWLPTCGLVLVWLLGVALGLAELFWLVWRHR